MGTGRLEVRENNPEGTLIAVMDINSPELTATKARLLTSPSSTTDLCFLFSGSNLKIDTWKFR
jgi:hypothetical protein